MVSTGLQSRLVSIDTMRIERGQVLDRAFEDKAVLDQVIAQFTDAARVGIGKGAETIISLHGISSATILAFATAAHRSGKTASRSSMD